MTLVDIARGHVKVGATRAHTESIAGQNWELSYMFGKLGKGYMRKALECYGLEQADGKQTC